MDLLRGFPMPRAHRKLIKWVNDTPHLSVKGAQKHKDNISKVTPEMQSKVREWLLKAHVRGAQRAIDVHTELGDKGVFDMLVSLDTMNMGGAKFLPNMLKNEVTEWRMDPTLDAEEYPFIASKLHAYTQNISQPALKRFESTAFLKYLSDSNVRNFEGYVKQVKDSYIPSRRAFRLAKLPNMEAYELSLELLFHEFGSVADDLGKTQALVDQGDFLATVRRDTFGGAPYYRNMADYVSKDETDETEYADLYDHLALLWLLLHPTYKRKLMHYYQYSALERVQAGGVSEYLGTETKLEDFKRKPNKQRFVQAESAVFPRALKAAHDIIRDLWKNHNSTLGVDKISEEAVSDAMKRITRYAIDNNVTVQGADYTNFDASILLHILNDGYFNVMRMHLPKWFNSYVLDPYISAAFRSEIFVPGVGSIITTGIKSGMLFTNQADCYYANQCDMYEIIRMFQERGEVKVVYDFVGIAKP